MIDEGLFVRGAALGKSLKNRVPDLGLLKLALGHFEVEFCQIRTVQVPIRSVELRYKFPPTFCIPHHDAVCRRPYSAVYRMPIMPFS